MPKQSTTILRHPYSWAGSLRCCKSTLFLEGGQSVVILCSSLSGVVFMQVALYFQMYQADRKRLKSIVCPSLLDALIHSLTSQLP